MRLDLTRQADHGIRAMIWIARHDAGVRHKAAAIAHGAGIPVPFAARVLAGLNRVGVLDGRAGHTGGYRLGRRPEEISLLEIIEAMEGPLQARSCLMRDRGCGVDGKCPLHDAWSAAQDSLRQVLAETTLADAAEYDVHATLSTDAGRSVA